MPVRPSVLTLLAVVLLSGCLSQDARAARACRRAVSQHMIGGMRARFEQVEVSRGPRSPWRVSLCVKMRDADQLGYSQVRCDLDEGFELLDLQVVNGY